MSLPTDKVKSWEQLVLIRPAVVTLSLHVGVFAESDHVQAQLEVRNAVTNDLLVMESWPSFSMHDAEAKMRDVGRRYTELLLDALSPFADT